VAYTNTSATDLDDLLDKLYTFAVTTDGSWSGIYNEDLGNRQIGLSLLIQMPTVYRLMTSVNLPGTMFGSFQEL
jgi:hypothetical protein